MPLAPISISPAACLETELAVWDSVIDSLRFIDVQQGDPCPSREAFRIYARKLLWTAFSGLGWLPQHGEETEATLLRSRLIAELGALNDPEVMVEARRRFAALVRDRTAVPLALREPIAKAVAYSADQEIYADLLRLAREQESDQERMIYYRALAGARDAELIEQTVLIARSDPKLPPAQTLPFLEQAARESGDPDRVWRLVFTHRSEILERLSGLQRQQALSRIARASANPEVAFELRWADVTRANRGMRRFADEAAEEIEFKADLRTTLVPAVQQWIQAQHLLALLARAYLDGGAWHAAVDLMGRLVAHGHVRFAGAPGRRPGPRRRICPRRGGLPPRPGARRARGVQRLRDPAHPGEPVRRGGPAAPARCGRGRSAGRGEPGRAAVRVGRSARRAADRGALRGRVATRHRRRARRCAGRSRPCDEAERLYRRAGQLGALRAHSAYGVFLLEVRGDAAVAERELWEAARHGEHGWQSRWASSCSTTAAPQARPYVAAAAARAITTPRPLAEIDGEDPYDD